MTSFLLRLSTVIYHDMWLCDYDIFMTVTCNVMLTLNISSQNGKWKKMKKIVKSNVHNSNIIFLQGFFSGETNFHFYQFLSNFFKYSFSNFPSSHLYNIFAIYSSGNSLLLESLSSIISNFSCCLTSAFNIPSNSATTTFIFSKSSSLS